MSADETMRRMEILASGKTAQYFLTYAGPYFDDIERSVTARLKMQYRAGEYTESSLVACVAELCVIDDMRQKLGSKIQAMNSNMED